MADEPCQSLNRQKSLKWLQLKADSLLRLNIVHESTGIPLIDRIWFWRGHESSLLFADLVQTALKVGGSIKESGGLHFVLFEPLESPSISSRPPPASPSSFSSSPIVSPRRKKLLKFSPFKVSPHLSRLVFLRHSGFIISAFHGAAASWEAIDQLILHLISQFSRTYQEKVSSLTSELQALDRAKSKGHTVDIQPIQDHFQDFISIVNSQSLKLVSNN